MRVLLNGVGRIGKAILRIALDKKRYKNFNIVAINEINSNLDNIAYTINYDSTYGRFDNPFKVEDGFIKNSDAKIKILNSKSLEDIDFKSLNIDIVIDASGAKIDIDTLKSFGLKHILLTHPNSKADKNIILGVNEDSLDLENDKVISTSSCNATALMPVLKILEENFSIEYGDVTTIHPLLNHQKTLDGGCIGSNDRNIECNFEFGRSSTQNIIPSKTTTIDACSYVDSKINHEKFSSNSFRVPTYTVGAIDIKVCLEKEISKELLKDAFKKYEQMQKFDILLNSDEKLVSSDFQAQRFTSIIDNRFLDVKMGKMAKIILWYDNEWGYASKVVDILEYILKK